MEKHKNEEISTTSEKKTWMIPELVVVDKNVIEGGMWNYGFESGVYYGS